MSSHAINSTEVKNDRQRLVKELVADNGLNWQEQYKPGSFGCHELLDRAAFAAGIVEQYVQTHPACVQNPQWYALAEQAVAALNELYQRVGAEHASESDSVPGKSEERVNLRRLEVEK